LQKDPKQRPGDIGDARISLDETLSGAPEATPGFAARMPVWRHLLPWALFGATATAFAVFAWAPWRTVTTPARAELIRFQISLPEKVNMAVTGAFALSPDGRQSSPQLAPTEFSVSGFVLWTRSKHGPCLTPNRRVLFPSSFGLLIAVSLRLKPVESLRKLPSRAALRRRSAISAGTPWEALGTAMA
jgi:hypothetical protein